MVKAYEILLALSGMEKNPSDSETKHLDSRKSIHLKIIYLKGILFPKKILFLYDTTESRIS
jgi:hypothetical protein